MRAFLHNTVFFIGWLLSPLTFWNDAFINIPLAYLLANITIRAFPVNFLYTVMVFYWLSNFVGLFMMYTSGRHIVKSGKGIVRELISLIATIAVYTAVLAILGKMGILKPF